MLNFVAIKFFALALSTTRSLLLAALLGPKSYGLFGTLILFQQFLSFAALGMREGVTVRLARAHDSPVGVLSVYGTALSWGAGAGLVVLITLSIAHLFVDGSGSYLGWVGAISMLSILNEILININRNQNNLNKIALLEVVYNTVPLGVALWLWDDLSIVPILGALAAGLLINVTIYLATLPRTRVQHIQWHVAKQLLAIGFPLATLSAVTLLVNSIYVVLANRMKLGDTLGLIVFANTTCTMVLFALNTVAWAATARSMHHLYAEQSSQSERFRAERLRTAFRLGIVTAALVCLSTAVVFMVVLKDYTGAEVFAFYFCLLQAYGLLLFEEVNQLTVTGRSSWVIAGYCLLLALIVATHYAFPHATIPTLVIVGIIGYFLLALAAVWYCQTLRAHRGHDLPKLAFLFFPVSCAMLYASGGVGGAVLVCIAFAALALRFHRAQPPA